MDQEDGDGDEGTGQQTERPHSPLEPILAFPGQGADVVHD